MNEQTIMPAFVFLRRRQIELEGGFSLAGRLMVVGKRPKLKGNQRRLVGHIIQQLLKQVRSGQMPDDAIIYGWPYGRVPLNSKEITGNDEVMAAWAKACLTIEVRVDPRNDGMLRVDSDMAKQLRQPRKRLVASTN
jgi:hypothetical protein